MEKERIKCSQVLGVQIKIITYNCRWSMPHAPPSHFRGSSRQRGVSVEACFPPRDDRDHGRILCGRSYNRGACSCHTLDEARSCLCHLLIFEPLSIYPATDNDNASTDPDASIPAMTAKIATFPLTSLPEELISVVASHVSPSADLFHLALASKQLNRITTAHLYRHVSIFCGPKYRHYEIFFNLVILLLEQPQLAAYVQHLTIRGEWKRAWNAGRGCRIDNLHPVLQRAINRLTADRKSKRAWADNVIGWDREEALFAVFLHALPDLNTLDTSLKDMPGMHYMWLMKQISAEPVRLLGKLRNLALVLQEPTSYSEAELHKPWFRLPSLKRVFLYGFDSERETLRQEDMSEHLQYLKKVIDRRSTTRLSTAEHLEIREGFHTFHSLCDLILSFQGLRTFSFDFKFAHSHYYGDMFFTLLVSALAIHAPTLTALSLPQASNLRFASAQPDFLDLRRLPNLQCLMLSIRYLLSGIDVHLEQIEVIATKMVEKMPPGMQRLSIILDMNPDPERVCVSAIAYLLEEQPSMIPYLAELSVYSFWGAASGEELDKALRAHAVRNGVRLRLCKRLGAVSPEEERRVEWDDIHGEISWAPANYYEEYLHIKG